MLVTTWGSVTNIDVTVLSNYLKSHLGYQFVGCRKNMGNGTTKHKGWYEDNEGTVFYPPQQRCRKVQCPSAKKEFVKSLSKDEKQSLYVSWKYHIWKFHRAKFSKIFSFLTCIFFETDRNSLACLSNHFVKSKCFERCDTVTLWLMVFVTVKDSFGIFSSVQPCYYGIHGPTTVVLPYWPSFGFINAVFGVDHYWVMNIRICLFTLDLICRVFDPK